MLNTIIFLIPLVAFCLALSRLAYVVIFYLTVRRSIVVATQTVAVIAPTPGQLSYASADLALPLLGRHPYLVFLPIYILCVAPLVPLLAVFIDHSSLMNAPRAPLFPPFLIATSGAIFIFTVAYIVIAHHAMQRPDRSAPPAAASWSVRRPLLAALACLFALLGSMAVIEFRARRTLAAAEAEVQRLQEALHKSDDAESSSLYVRASAQYDLLGLKTISIGHGTPATPFPPAAAPIISLLHQATSSDQMPRFASDRRHPNILSLLKLLHCHATTELQHGHWDEARQDLAAIQTMARQFGNGNSFDTSAAAEGIDQVADDLLQRVCAAAITEAQLDAIPLQSRSWYSYLIRRYCEYVTLDMQSNVVSLARGKGSEDRLNIAFQRWIVLDASLRTIRMYRQQLAEARFAEWSGTAPLADSTALPDPEALPLGPWYRDFLASLFSCRVRRDLDDAGLAVLRYRMRNHRLPANLDEVVAAGSLASHPHKPVEWQADGIHLQPIPRHTVLPRRK